MVDIQNFKKLIEEDKFTLGIVKWFGGKNRQTEQQNDFGFIDSIGDGDVYVNIKDIDKQLISVSTFEPLSEGDFVIFKINRQSNKGFFATHLQKVKLKQADQQALILCLIANASDPIKILQTSEKWWGLLKNSLLTPSEESDTFFKKIEDIKSAEAYLNKFSFWPKLMNRFITNHSIKHIIKAGYSLSELPEEYIFNNVAQINLLFKTRTEKQRSEFFEDSPKKLFSSLIKRTNKTSSSDEEINQFCTQVKTYNPSPSKAILNILKSFCEEIKNADDLNPIQFLFNINTIVNVSNQSTNSEDIFGFAVELLGFETLFQQGIKLIDIPLSYQLTNKDLITKYTLNLSLLEQSDFLSLRSNGKTISTDMITVLTKGLEAPHSKEYLSFLVSVYDVGLISSTIIKCHNAEALFDSLLNHCSFDDLLDQGCRFINLTPKFWVSHEEELRNYIYKLNVTERRGFLGLKVDDSFSTNTLSFFELLVQSDDISQFFLFLTSIYGLKNIFIIINNSENPQAFITLLLRKYKFHELIHHCKNDKPFDYIQPRKNIGPALNYFDYKSLINEVDDVLKYLSDNEKKSDEFIIYYKEIFNIAEYLTSYTCNEKVQKLFETLLNYIYVEWFQRGVFYNTRKFFVNDFIEFYKGENSLDYQLWLPKVLPNYVQEKLVQKPTDAKEFIEKTLKSIGIYSGLKKNKPLKFYHNQDISSHIEIFIKELSHYTDNEICNFFHPAQQSSEDIDLAEISYDLRCKDNEALSKDSLLCFVFNSFITTEVQLGNRYSDLFDFVKKILNKESVDVKNFVRVEYKKVFKTNSEFSNLAVISRIISKIRIKYKVYTKDMSFVQDLSNDSLLKNEPEFFILSSLLPLIYAGNSDDVIQRVFFSSLWEQLRTRDFNINSPSIFKLFPQCNTLSNLSIDLSCEAFYWKEEELENTGNYNKQRTGPVFLCRSKRCTTPQVLPNLGRNYLDFSIYDWLAHYGVDYINATKPTKRDFPIKLAGYFNRLREIYDRLHCRCCNTLMMPNMKYARVEVKLFNPETKLVETSDVNAAYRMTVFHCGNKSCEEFENNYYINHCIGFKCYEIIDSRDLESKCSNDRYICKSCGSCCNTHKDDSRNPINPNYDDSELRYEQLHKDSPFYNKK